VEEIAKSKRRGCQCLKGFFHPSGPFCPYCERHAQCKAQPHGKGDQRKEQVFSALVPSRRLAHPPYLLVRFQYRAHAILQQRRQVVQHCEASRHAFRVRSARRKRRLLPNRPRLPERCCQISTTRTTLGGRLNRLKVLLDPSACDGPGLAAPFQMGRHPGSCHCADGQCIQTGRPSCGLLSSL
jgi:hypothetical protein